MSEIVVKPLFSFTKKLIINSDCVRYVQNSPIGTGRRREKRIMLPANCEFSRTPLLGFGDLVITDSSDRIEVKRIPAVEKYANMIRNPTLTNNDDSFNKGLNILKKDSVKREAGYTSEELEDKFILVPQYENIFRDIVYEEGASKVSLFSNKPHWTDSACPCISSFVRDNRYGIAGMLHKSGEQMTKFGLEVNPVIAPVDGCYYGCVHQFRDDNAYVRSLGLSFEESMFCIFIPRKGLMREFVQADFYHPLHSAFSEMRNRKREVPSLARLYKEPLTQDIYDRIYDAYYGKALRKYPISQLPKIHHEVIQKSYDSGCEYTFN